jgi:putative transposase
MKNLNTIDDKNLKYNYRSTNLPHRYDIIKPIFITYRLKFTLPKSILREISTLRNEWQTRYRSLSTLDKQHMQKNKDYTNFCQFDELLAKSNEIPQILHRPDLTDVISLAYKYFDNRYYELLSYCIMPNHVHVLIIPILQSDVPVVSLAHINYSWKRYTANKINKILNRKGSFWQAESYDHLISSDHEFYHTIEYIIDNPVKAGFVQNWNDWYGTWLKEELIPIKVK